MNILEGVEQVAKHSPLSNADMLSLKGQFLDIIRKIDGHLRPNLIQNKVKNLDSVRKAINAIDEAAIDLKPRVGSSRTHIAKGITSILPAEVRSGVKI